MKRFMVLRVSAVLGFAMAGSLLGQDGKAGDGLPWGEAVEGIQVRLRAEREQWKFGERPTFALDVRNEGKETVSFVDFMAQHCEIQYDGKWYGWGSSIIGGSYNRRLAPGAEMQDGIKVTLVRDWCVPKTEMPLKLAPADEKVWGEAMRLRPGKHKVVVRFIPVLGEGRNPTGDRLRGEGVQPRVLSNTLEIEIMPLGPGEDIWGKVQVRLEVEQERWKATETPGFRMEVWNQGMGEFPFLESKESLEVEVDGKWYEEEPPDPRAARVMSRMGSRMGPIMAGQSRTYVKNLRWGWRSKQGQSKLELGAGKHRVRVAFILEPEEAGIAKAFRGESKVVKFEIMAKTPEETASEELGRAIGGGDLAKVNEMLDRFPGLLNAEDGKGNIPLHGAIMNGQVEIVRALIGRGADVNAHAATHGGAGALHLVCEGGMLKDDQRVEVARILLKAGADPLLESRSGSMGSERPIDRAIVYRSSNPELVKVIREATAPTVEAEKKGIRAATLKVMEAIRDNDGEALRDLTMNWTGGAEASWEAWGEKLREAYAGRMGDLTKIERVAARDGWGIAYLPKAKEGEGSYDVMMLMKLPNGRWQAFRHTAQRELPKDDSDVERSLAQECVPSYGSFRNAVFERNGWGEGLRVYVGGMQTGLPKDRGRLMVRPWKTGLRLSFEQDRQTYPFEVEVLGDRVRRWEGKDRLEICRSVRWIRDGIVLEARNGKVVLRQGEEEMAFEAHEGKVRLAEMDNYSEANGYTVDVDAMRAEAEK